MSDPTRQLEVLRKATAVLTVESMKLVPAVLKQAHAAALYLSAKGADEEARKVEAWRIGLQWEAGRWLRKAPKQTGQLAGKQEDGAVRRSHDATTETYAAQGIDKHDASRWQRIALLPDKSLRDYQAKAEKPTTAGALRIVKQQERDQARAKNAEQVKTAAPLPDGPFATIVVDPPWDWGDEGDVSQFGRGDPKYKTMTHDELLAFPVGDRAAPNAHLYLWITNRSLPKGFGLIARWGFRFVTILTWCKPSIGMGNYFRGSTEHLLFCVKGSLALMRLDVGTWFSWPRGQDHSAKPEEAYDLIETCSPGPYLDAFARRARRGWMCWGAEA